METFLPTSITSLIYEFAGIQEYWKNRFSNDVLPSINKGYHLVGMICDVHGFIQSHQINGCDCDDRYPCSNCYSYGPTLCSHDRYESVSYEDIKPHHSDFTHNPYIPYEHWWYFEHKYATTFEKSEFWINQNAYEVYTYNDILNPLIESIRNK